MRQRHAASAAGLLMFVVGFIVAPCLHNLDHRADHEHAPDGSVHFHARAQPEAAPASDVSSHTAEPNTQHTHGAGSLAHFGVALTASGFFVVPDVFATVAQLAPPRAKPDPPVDRWYAPTRSRGPPPA